jgi:hypothetical protein
MRQLALPLELATVSPVNGLSHCLPSCIKGLNTKLHQSLVEVLSTGMYIARRSKKSCFLTPREPRQTLFISAMKPLLRSNAGD